MNEPRNLTDDQRAAFIAALKGASGEKVSIQFTQTSEARAYAKQIQDAMVSAGIDVPPPTVWRMGCEGRDGVYIYTESAENPAPTALGLRDAFKAIGQDVLIERGPDPMTFLHIASQPE